MNWQNNTKVYASICIIKNLLSICAPDFNFEKKLKKVLRRVSKNQLSVMGFPGKWKKKF